MIGKCHVTVRKRNRTADGRIAWDLEPKADQGQLVRRWILEAHSLGHPPPVSPSSACFPPQALFLRSRHLQVCVALVALLLCFGFVACCAVRCLLYCMPGLGSCALLSHLPNIPQPLSSLVLPACCVLSFACSLPLCFPPVSRLLLPLAVLVSLLSHPHSHFHSDSNSYFTLTFSHSHTRTLSHSHSLSHTHTLSLCGVKPHKPLPSPLQMSQFQDVRAILCRRDSNVLTNAFRHRLQNLVS